MKTSLQLISVLLASATVVYSQETNAADYNDSSTAPMTLSAARIFGEILDGTPPPPAPPKPSFVVPAKDILDATIHEQGGRTITIQKIKPIPLFPPPLPVDHSSLELNEEFRQRLAEQRENHPKSHLLILGATVFQSEGSPPRTLVRYWPGGGQTNITFWSSADFSLIAGGINSFVDSSGNIHQLMMSLGKVDIDQTRELSSGKVKDYAAPDIPAFAEGNASFKFSGEQPSAEDLVALRSLHDIYNSEYARLKVAHQGREAARIEHEAYQKANPPQPKNITLNYWRTETPASAGKGDNK